MTSDGKSVFVDIWAKDWYLTPKKQRQAYIFMRILESGGYEKQGDKVVCVVDAFTVHKSYWNHQNTFAYKTLDKMLKGTDITYAGMDDWDVPDWISD